MRTSSYDAENRAEEKAARRAVPIAFTLFETLMALEDALWHAELRGAEPDPRRAALRAAIEQVSETRADALRAASFGDSMPEDVTEASARATMESLGLMERVIVCADCMREIGPESHECAAQRASNRRHARMRAAVAR